MAATKQETAGGAPYYVPPEPKRWPAIGLAVGVHALLLAFLVIGVSWQNHEPVAVEAEVWDLKTQVAAPPPPPPQPAPEPQEETPPPQPAPKVAPPPPVEQPAPLRQPDIALEREKKRKQELKRKEEEERVERERERELAQQQKREDEKKAKALAEKKAQELAKKEEEAEKKELAKKEEADKKKKAEKEKAAKDKAEKLAKEKAEKAENAKLDKIRNEDMKRMIAGAGNPGSTGTAEKSTAPRRDNGYIAAITAKVKGNTHYAGSTDEPGNPTVTFRVEQLPTGDIVSARMTKSSGIPAFDESVKRAIDLSSPLPKKKDGTVERSLEINFHMKDMQ
jgi:colicin import membrane protein